MILITSDSQPKKIMYFSNFISTYEHRNVRPKRRMVVRVMPFNSHNLETVVPYFCAMAPKVSPDWIL